MGRNLKVVFGLLSAAGAYLAFHEINQRLNPTLVYGDQKIALTEDVDVMIAKIVAPEHVYAPAVERLVVRSKEVMLERYPHLQFQIESYYINLLPRLMERRQDFYAAIAAAYRHNFSKEELTKYLLFINTDPGKSTLKAWKGRVNLSDPDKALLMRHEKTDFAKMLAERQQPIAHSYNKAFNGWRHRIMQEIENEIVTIADAEAKNKAPKQEIPVSASPAR